jgi:putative hydrolase of the HAD superfamily
MEHEFLRKSARFVEGATATLEELRHRGIRLALVTNASPSVNVVLKTMDLDPLVDVVVISSEIGVRKPDPEIYLEALRRIDSEAVNAAFVGDGNDCELDGAKKLGMTTVWLRRDVVRAVTSEQSTLASADYTIDALSALPPLLLDEILPQ